MQEEGEPSALSSSPVKARLHPGVRVFTATTSDRITGPEFEIFEMSKNLAIVCQKIFADGSKNPTCRT